MGNEQFNNTNQQIRLLLLSFPPVPSTPLPPPHPLHLTSIPSLHLPPGGGDGVDQLQAQHGDGGDEGAVEQDISLRHSVLPGGNLLC